MGRHLEDDENICDTCQQVYQVGTEGTSVHCNPCDEELRLEEEIDTRNRNKWQG